MFVCRNRSKSGSVIGGCRVLLKYCDARIYCGVREPNLIFIFPHANVFLFTVQWWHVSTRVKKKEKRKGIWTVKGVEDSSVLFVGKVNKLSQSLLPFSKWVFVYGGGFKFLAFVFLYPLVGSVIKKKYYNFLFGSLCLYIYKCLL